MTSTSAAKLSYGRGGVCPPIVQPVFHMSGEVLCPPLLQPGFHMAGEVLCARLQAGFHVVGEVFCSQGQGMCKCVSSSLTSYDGDSDVYTSSTSAAKLSYGRGGV